MVLKPQGLNERGHLGFENVKKGRRGVLFPARSSRLVLGVCAGTSLQRCAEYLIALYLTSCSRYGEEWAETPPKHPFLPADYSYGVAILFNIVYLGSIVNEVLPDLILVYLYMKQRSMLYKSL